MPTTHPGRASSDPPVRAAADVPVLLLVFNRPQKVRQMIVALREVKPPRLFVAADGPRPGVGSDVDLCAAARQALDDIDWPCEVRTLFQVDNLGCKRGPETAITWFFSQVTAGIILEDDCLPTPGFLPFCAELLDRFAADQRVMMISGFNLLGKWPQADSSYLVSRSPQTWGWATWARAWRHYDPEMGAWKSRAARRSVRARMSFLEYLLTRRRFDQVQSGGLDAWDYAWAFAVLRYGGLSITPVGNMITNIGFGEDATHTKNLWSADARVPTVEIGFPLVHPDRLEPSAAFEKALFKGRFPLRRRIVTMLPPAVADGIRKVVYRHVIRRRPAGEVEDGSRSRP